MGNREESVRDKVKRKMVSNKTERPGKTKSGGVTGEKEIPVNYLIQKYLFCRKSYYILLLDYYYLLITYEFIL